MHPNNKAGLKAFIAPYLAIPGDDSEYRDGRFQVREGRSHRSSTERVAAVQWSTKGAARPVSEVAAELEARIDLLTVETHETIYIVAFYKGDTNPAAWFAAIEGGATAGTGGVATFDDGFARIMERGGGADAIMVVNARIAMELSTGNRELMAELGRAYLQIGELSAQLNVTRSMLDGALATAPSQRIETILNAYAPYVGPAVGKVIAGLVPPQAATVPDEPGAALDYHIAALRSGLAAIAGLVQSNPESMNDARRAGLFELYQLVNSWFNPPAAAGPTPEAT